MTLRRIDLNADLGEGGGSDAAILEVVTSASVACGFHAGDPFLMRRTCEAALVAGVRFGAHPSYRDREGFGRRDMEVDPEVLSADIAYQVGAFQGIAALAGGTMAFVKAHGALYNRAAADASVADALLRGLRYCRVPALLTLANSPLQGWASGAGLAVYAEAFADRRYRADGTLSSRRDAGAVIEDPEEIAARAVSIATENNVEASDGSLVPVVADSICVHGDSPDALRCAAAVRAALEAAGVVLEAFV
jgi:5-oxoprolinase (ATP-hydrolysing) subunit A